MLIKNTTNLIFILISLYLSFYAIKQYIVFNKDENIGQRKTLYWGMGFIALMLAFAIKMFNKFIPVFSTKRVFIYESLLIGISCWLHAYAIMMISYKYKKFKKAKLHTIYWLLLIVIIPVMTILPTNELYPSLLNIGIIGIILYTLYKITFRHPLFLGFVLMILARILYILNTLTVSNVFISEIQLGLMTVSIMTIGISSYLIIKNRRKLNE